MTPSTSVAEPVTTPVPSKAQPRATKPARAVSAPPDLSGSVSGNDLVSVMKQVIDASRPAEKITVANRIARNPMNPTNEVRKFKKPFFQNFEAVDTDDVTPEEYVLIPQLRPGLFIKNRKGVPLVEVIDVKRGASRGVHLRYDNSKVDKSMELQTYAPTLVVMLEKCIKEAAQQQEVLKARRAAGLSDNVEDDD